MTSRCVLRRHRRRWLGSLLVLACCRAPSGSEPDGVPPDADRAVALPGSGRAEPPDAPLRAVEVAPGIHALLQPAARRFNDCNTTLVFGDAGVVVIDAPQRGVALEWARSYVAARSESPHHGLVSTHWHLDHSLGIARWRAAQDAAGRPLEHWGHAALAPLLAVEGQQQLDERRAWLPGVIERGVAMQASGRLADGTALDDAQQAKLEAELLELREEVEVLASVELLAPTHGLTERTTLALGSLTLELYPLRAHTTADLVVYIPAAGVLVTGDVLDEIPFGGHGRPREWLAALERLAALHPTIIIPGHGPVLGPEHLDRTIALWQALLEQATLAIERAETPAQRYAAWQASPAGQAMRASLVSDPVSEQVFDVFMPESLARTIAELRGELDGPALGP